MKQTDYENETLTRRS